MSPYEDEQYARLCEPTTTRSARYGIVILLVLVAVIFAVAAGAA